MAIAGFATQYSSVIDWWAWPSVFVGMVRTDAAVLAVLMTQVDPDRCLR
ncbi:hypothetical protein SAMN04487968_11652 [Nocardioides terrae]|uniref:Uncharacterized protein n=1 Tax=Nocardioides terrae TaxID=574651 RepID=A0A1I1NEI1_9ACTN|nr:hypothetical protein SAMN04487968_11652 [Nocardioides terrae]